jgi:hypothetical protein
MDGNVVVETISGVPFGIILAWVSGIVAIIVAIVFFMIKFYKFIEKYRKSRNAQDKKEEEFEMLKRDTTDLKSSLELLQIASREILLNILNDRYQRYMALGYIPEDEVEEFVHMHDAYKGLGGNHTGDYKYEKAIALPPAPVPEELN